ncbi:MAG: AraC family transcriptional regulator [Terriglobales bacterium]|jgi:AraC-like DNA-binding protein
MIRDRNSWKATSIEGVECFRSVNTVHHYPRHSHEFYSIGVIEDGIGGNVCRGMDHQIPVGSMVVIHPDEVHTGYAAGDHPLTYRMLRVETGVFARYAGARGSHPHFRSTVIRNPAIANQLALSHRELEFGLDPLREEELLIETLTGLLASESDSPSAAQGGAEPRAIRAIRDYLEAHYGSKVRLAELVQLTGLDRAYLIRSFRRIVGMPPHEYLTQVRVRRAAGALALGESIADVAALAGFADQSHLTRHFKRITGTTPGQYASGHFRPRR